MTALTEKRILGIRNGDAVLVPPMEWDPATGAELAHDFVEVGPAGTVESWTWVPEPSIQHPLDRPFGFAFVKLDGATTPLLHAVDAGRPARWRSASGRTRWRGAREGRLGDIVCFVPGEEPESRATTRPGRRAGDPHGLPRLDHLPEPGAAGAARAVASARTGCWASGARCASGSTPAAVATARSARWSSVPTTRST